MSKLTIAGLIMVVLSSLVRLAQTLFMPGILERTQIGPPDPMLVPLGIAIFASYLVLPLGVIFCLIGLLSKKKTAQVEVPPQTG